MIKHLSFKDLTKFFYLTLFKSKNQNRLNFTRFLYVFGIFLFFLPIELANNIGFLLDKIFFPKYQQVKIKQPIFIIGNPRSGTTFLQRLLAEDKNQLCSMRTWEILFAPSIIQRKFYLFLRKIDILIGRPIVKITDVIKNFLDKKNAIHKHALRAYEEDQYLMFHIFSTLTIWLTTGIFTEVDKYIYFDQQMAEAEKKRIMDYYLQCVKRHMYTYGPDKYYLAKNPTASPKVKTLLKAFPDAKFIYLARNPLQMVPSYISLHQFGWKVLGNVKSEFSQTDKFLELAQHWYTYPLEILDELPSEQKVIVNFNDMISDTESVVSKIYQQLNLKMDDSFYQTLHQRSQQAKNHTSRHKYSLAEFGLTEEEIRKRFAQTFERFEFKTKLN